MTEGERRAAAVDGIMADVVIAEPRADLDYAAVVDPLTLAPAPERLEPGEYRLLIAARVGKPRLIDNDGVTVPAPGGAA